MDRFVSVFDELRCVTTFCEGIGGFKVQVISRNEIKEEKKKLFSSIFTPEFGK